MILCRIHFFCRRVSAKEICLLDLGFGWRIRSGFLAAEVLFHSHNTLITMTQSALESHFLESVVSLNPKTATFDCDGTLWSVDAGESFFSWELEEKLVLDEIVRWARQRYANYKAGEVAEDVMCGEMVSMHRGLREEIVQRACDTFFAQSFAPHIF